MEKIAEYLRKTITDKMTLKDIVDTFDMVKEYYDSEIIKVLKLFCSIKSINIKYMFNC